MSKLICLESCDAGGKSTQIKFIIDYLKSLNLKVASFHFPMYGHNTFSHAISKYLRGEFGELKSISPYFAANLFAMDKFMFLPELKEALNKNDIVILDRYVYSNIAFQGARFPLHSEKNIKIKNWISDFEFNFLSLPYPDLNIYLDLPIDTIKQRLEVEREGKDREYIKGSQDIHEQDIEFQEQVRLNYLAAMESPNCKIIKCAMESSPIPIILSPEEVFNSYKEILINSIIH